MKTIDLARQVVESLEDKKAEDIILLDLQNLAPVGNYFVICSANNERALGGLRDAVLDSVKRMKISKPAVEGASKEGWMLVDFGSVIVHIFSNAQRQYYQLEELWSDAKVLLHVQ
ncbi:MAG: ribosome silencing factor [Chloroflexi bacterium]|nr:ribosome silencing factor [Chloroflexota bacterium]